MASSDKQLKEAAFSIMCEVIAYYQQVDADVASGKVLDLYAGQEQQKALIYGRDKVVNLVKADRNLKGFQEVRDRIDYFYLQTDGTYNFPNSAEGDLIKMVHEQLDIGNSISNEGKN